METNNIDCNSPATPAESEAAKPPLASPAKSPASTQPALPAPEDTLAETLAETVDWVEAKKASEGVTKAQTDQARQALDQQRTKIEKAGALERNYQKALIEGLCGLYEAGKDLHAEPGVLLCLAESAGIKVTKATLNSPFLLTVKTALPQLDPKTQSLYAKALHYGLACSLDAAGFAAALRAQGVRELAARESKRRRLQKGEPAVLDETDLLTRFRKERRRVGLSAVTPPADGELVLLIAGPDAEGKLAIYDCDDDRKRLLAAVRRADKRGSLITRPDSNPTDAA